MEKSRTVSLALGSGGARGLAHIGVIQVFEEEGFRIGNIAGSSMGACVGGIYCANKLPTFTDWVLTLNRRETLRLMDFTMSTQGVIKGRKVLEHLKGMLGEIRIEDFEIPYTAVATDVKTKQEVWMRNGDLYSVIRASSSIPTLMMPSKLGDRILIDGGVLNPLPLEPLVPKTTDLLVAVNINANHEGHQRYAEVEVKDGDQKEQTEEETSAYTTRMVNTVKGWLNMNKIEETDSNQDTTLNYLGMLNKTYDFMQDRMCEQSIEIHRPDIVVNIPRHVGTTLEFYRAEEMLEEGRSAAKKAIEAWRKNPIHA
ncbi:MAG: patatin-like phospholipase family protein [Flavobacteriales bacterium]|nr:patatin-like phospholipase family protein [Flavobacteriales bacterium]